VLFEPKHSVPVFPLPQLALFPRTVVPLHVFELRYRAMVRDAARGERLIAMALLQPGWERDYHGTPAFYPLGCLGRIEHVEWLPDDCYDLRLAGVARVRFEQVTQELPYRSARVRLLEQEPLPDGDPLVELERRALLDAFTRVTTEFGTPHALRSDIALEALVNHVCMALTMDPIDKLSLLEVDSLLERSRRVRERLDQGLRTASGGGEGERN
jgi:Lon protease-like protein